MKKQKTTRKKSKKTIYAIIAIALATIIILSQSQPQPENIPKAPATPKQQITDTQILENLQEFPELKPYAAYDTKITHLTDNDLKTLAEKQPVIYANLTGKNLCKIEYTSTRNSYLVIYDTENDRILKQFRILNMQLNN